MAWDPKYPQFGVVRIEGKSVKVYQDSSNYYTIHVGEMVTNASWAGGELNVTLANGRVRRYSDKSNYKTIG